MLHHLTPSKSLELPEFIHFRLVSLSKSECDERQNPKERLSLIVPNAETVIEAQALIPSSTAAPQRPEHGPIDGWRQVLLFWRQYLLLNTMKTESSPSSATRRIQSGEVVGVSIIPGDLRLRWRLYLVKFKCNFLLTVDYISSPDYDSDQLANTRFHFHEVHLQVVANF